MKKTYLTLIIVLLLLIIMFILYSCSCSYSYSSVKREGFENQNKKKSVEIVISRYSEDLEWLKTEPFNSYSCSITIYNKGNNEDFYKPENTKEIIKLPNVGRCDHTYLYHIIKNYDKLEDIVVFLPGSTEMEKKQKKATILLGEIEKHNSAVFVDIQRHEDVKTDNYFFELKEWKASNTINSKINPEAELTPAPIRPFGKWFDARFGDTKVQAITHLGIFSVAKEDILQHPKSYYENLIKDFDNSSNPEVGHYFERAWAAVFHPMNNTKIL